MWGKQDEEVVERNLTPARLADVVQTDDELKCRRDHYLAEIPKHRKGKDLMRKKDWVDIGATMPLPKKVDAVKEASTSRDIEELVVDRVMWERNNPGKHFAEEGWEEEEGENGRAILPKPKHEPGVLLKKRSRKEAIMFVDTVDDGIATLKATWQDGAPLRRPRRGDVGWPVHRLDRRRRSRCGHCRRRH